MSPKITATLIENPEIPNLNRNTYSIEALKQLVASEPDYLRLEHTKDGTRVIATLPMCSIHEDTFATHMLGSDPFCDECSEGLKQAGHKLKKCLFEASDIIGIGRFQTPLHVSSIHQE